MTINLTDQEKEFLLELFEASEKEMILGIDHADVREYKNKLKQKLAVLEGVRDKISHPAVPSAD